MARDYDIVVIGLGIAGSLVAARASDDPDVRVLAIEAGPEFPDADRPGNEAVRIPALAPTLWGGDYDWNFHTAPQQALGGRRVGWPRGKVIGGSSSINVQAWVRGNAEDYDAWSSFAPDWNWQTALAAFQAIEDTEAGPAPWRGVGGALPVERKSRSTGPLQAALFAGAAAIGLAPTDVNGPNQEGIDPGSSSTRDGLRVTFADAFLEPVRARPNLTVLTGAHVTRVRFDGRRATGVEYVVDGSTVVVRAAEVVLAAGAVGTPHLLLLSGIGPAEHLRTVGIEVVADRPGVGGNLHDHPAVWTGVAGAGAVDHAAAEAAQREAVRQFLSDRTGPLAASTGLVSFVRSRAGLTAPDLEFILTDSVVGPDGRRVPGVGINWVLLQPASRGRITLDSVDPWAAPVIDPGYLTDADGADLAGLLRGFRLARRVLDAPALAPFLGDPVDPALRTDADDATAVDFIRRTVTTIYHPVGSARLGRPDDPLAVVGPDLRVLGVEGLSVVDASVIPAITRGHTAAPTAVVAHRASELLTGRSYAAPVAVAVGS